MAHERADGYSTGDIRPKHSSTSIPRRLNGLVPLNANLVSCTLDECIIAKALIHRGQYGCRFLGCNPPTQFSIARTERRIHPSLTYGRAPWRSLILRKVETCSGCQTTRIAWDLNCICRALACDPLPQDNVSPCAHKTRTALLRHG